jgi:hypothetical protein
VGGEEVHRRRWWILAVLWRGGAVIPAASAAWRGTGLPHPSPGFRLSFRKLRVTEYHWRRRVSKEQKINTKSDLEERNRPTTAGSEYFETVIIGGGQAGLSVGYHLKKQGRPFVILDANERIGDAWRKR